MDLNRAVKLTAHFKATLDDIFSQARTYLSTHDRILENITKRLYQDPDYQKLPRWAHSELWGYQEAKFNEINHELEWGYLYNGKVVNVHEIPTSEYRNLRNEDGRHYWKGRPDRIYSGGKE